MANFKSALIFLSVVQVECDDSSIVSYTHGSSTGFQSCIYHRAY